MTSSVVAIQCFTGGLSLGFRLALAARVDKRSMTALTPSASSAETVKADHLVARFRGSVDKLYVLDIDRADDATEFVEIVPVNIEFVRIGFDRRARDRADAHADLPLGAQVMEGFPMEQPLRIDVVVVIERRGRLETAIDLF